MQKAEEEAKKHYDQLLRVMAEFDNYKKRIARENEELLKYAQEPLLGELAGIIDDLDRVESHMPENATPEAKAIGDGVALVHKNLQKILDKYGLKAVETEGKKFDPAMHEAVAYVENKELPAGSIISTHRKGYTLFDRLLRPAQVIVSKGNGQPQ